ncbi:MAG: hypothetical protein PHN57_00420 [Candidatus Omnitrophica bacterium]|nr:hypothetical protein [Candidatus Omnitrophota bacterium]
MKKILFVCSISILSVLAVSRCACAEVTEAAVKYTQVTGTVLSFNDTNITVAGDDKLTYSFIVNERTEISGEIATGVKVSVAWTLRRTRKHKGASRRIAISIKVLK